MEGQCRLPLTQADLADALGLSVVHVNRVLQRLRGDGLISMTKGLLLVLDPEGLKAAGDFRPDYLYPGKVGQAAARVRPDLQTSERDAEFRSL